MKKSFLLLPLLCLLAACAKDDYHYPSVKLEFLTAQATASGISSVLNDAGETYPVVSDGSGISSKKDTTIRIVTNYELITADDGSVGAKLYSSVTTVSPLPQPAEDFKGGVKQDPVTVVGAWKGLNYLNVLIDIKSQNKLHTFGFIEEDVATVGSKRTVRISLYHDEGDDVRAYSRRVYLSIPLRHYVNDTITSLVVQFNTTNYNGEAKADTVAFNF
ncbi:MAG: hypothetical protein LBM62_08820 [Mediterranea sp.]|jgi:hypothetical protein|nr:hypothetical protein [Mediterranea sp.]